jgi:hypothetical protein
VFHAVPVRGVASIASIVACASLTLGLLPSSARAQPRLAAAARIPDAQEPAPKFYAGGLLLVAGERRTSATGVVEPWVTSGAGLGFSALFGAGRRLGVEVEATRPPAENGLLEFRISGGTVRQSAALRHTLVSVFVRWRGPQRRVAVEPVGGLSASFFRGSKQEIFTPDVGLPSGYTSPLTVNGLGVGGGVDAVVRLAPALSLVGSFRLHRVIWRDLEEYYPAVPDLPGWLTAIGGGIRAGWGGAREAEDARYPRAIVVTSSMSPRRGYAGASVGAFTQPVGEADGHYLSVGLGGSGVAVAAAIGGFVGRSWSAAAEVSRGPAFAAAQWFTSRVRFDTVYRDTLVGGFLRWHPGRLSATAIEPVFGGLICIGRAQRTETDFAWAGMPSGPPRDASVTRLRFGVAGGADVARWLTRHVALVVSFRLNVLARRDARNDQPPELGVGPWVLHYAAGARYSF